jgi:hypothetical protein
MWGAFQDVRLAPNGRWADCPSYKSRPKSACFNLYLTK